MKILKAKTSHPKKQIFPINDLNYNQYYTKNNSKLVCIANLEKEYIIPRRNFNL